MIKWANCNIKGTSRITWFMVMVPVTGCHIVMVDSFIMDHLRKDGDKWFEPWRPHCGLQLFSIRERFKSWYEPHFQYGTPQELGADSWRPLPRDGCEGELRRGPPPWCCSSPSPPRSSTSPVKHRGTLNYNLQILTQITSLLHSFPYYDRTCELINFFLCLIKN